MDVPVSHLGFRAVDFGVEMRRPIDGIVFQQMKVGVGIKKIVDGHNFRLVLIGGVQRPEYLTPDTAEAVDGDSYFVHGSSSF